MGTKVIHNLEKEQMKRPAIASERFRKRSGYILILFSVVVSAACGLILGDVSTPGKAWLTEAEYNAAIGR